MNCKQMQDVILTDYMDGQLSPKRMKQIDDHLITCLNCRMLANDTRQGIEAAFKDIGRAAVDPFVWQRIKNKINDNASIEHAGVRRGDILKNFLQPFKPWALALSVFFMLAAGMVMSQGLVGREPYLTYIIAADGQNSDDVSSSIETYFL